MFWWQNMTPATACVRVHLHEQAGHDGLGRFPIWAMGRPCTLHCHAATPASLTRCKTAVETECDASIRSCCTTPPRFSLHQHGRQRARITCTEDRVCHQGSPRRRGVDGVCCGGMSTRSPMSETLCPGADTVHAHVQPLRCCSSQHATLMPRLSARVPGLEAPAQCDIARSEHRFQHAQTGAGCLQPIPTYVTSRQRNVTEAVP